MSPNNLMSSADWTRILTATTSGTNMIRKRLRWVSLGAERRAGYRHPRKRMASHTLYSCWIQLSKAEIPCGSSTGIGQRHRLLGGPYQKTRSLPATTSSRISYTGQKGRTTSTSGNPATLLPRSVSRRRSFCTSSARSGSPW